MIKTTALVLNWAALAVLVIGIGGLIRTNSNIVSPASFVPLLPYATALATYHLPPRLPMVWVSLALNVLFAVIGLFGVVAAVTGFAAQPLLAGVVAMLVLVIPCGFNVRNMLRIKRGMAAKRLQAAPEMHALEPED